MCMFCRSLFVLFLLAILLSVLRFTDSDYQYDMKFMEDWNNKSAEMVDVSLDSLQQQNQKTIGNFVIVDRYFDVWHK